jgi:hypothetical protein
MFQGRTIGKSHRNSGLKTKENQAPAEFFDFDRMARADRLGRKTAVSPVDSTPVNSSLV